MDDENSCHSLMRCIKQLSIYTLKQYNMLWNYDPDVNTQEVMFFYLWRFECKTKQNSELRINITLAFNMIDLICKF